MTRLVGILKVKGMFKYVTIVLQYEKKTKILKLIDSSKFTNVKHTKGDSVDVSSCLITYKLTC